MLIRREFFIKGWHQPEISIVGPIVENDPYLGIPEPGESMEPLLQKNLYTCDTVQVDLIHDPGVDQRATVYLIDLVPENTKAKAAFKKMYGNKTGDYTYPSSSLPLSERQRKFNRMKDL